MLPTIKEPRSSVKGGKCKNLKFLRQNNLEKDEDLSQFLYIDLHNKILTREVLKKHVKIKTTNFASFYSKMF